MTATRRFLPRRVIGVALAGLCAAMGAHAAPPAADVTAAGVTLRSVQVELPAGDLTFGGGADAQAINDNCLACHSADMVLNQPAMTRAGWQAEVDKMRATYKAPVADADVPAIVAYLVSVKGPGAGK